MPSKKIVGWSLVGIAAPLALIVGLHQSVDYMATKMLFPIIKPQIDSTITAYHKKDDKHHTIDPEHVKEFGVFVDSMNIERVAYKRYMGVFSLYGWNDMQDTVILGYHLKYKNGVLWTMYKGLLFEANYIRSKRKFYIINPYGVEIEALKRPIIH